MTGKYKMLTMNDIHYNNISTNKIIQQTKNEATKHKIKTQMKT